MRWRNKHRNYSRPARPKAKKLTKDEQQQLLERLTAEVERSPLLAALGCQISAARGRFYVDRIGYDDDEERWGRTTPLDESRQYLLERERRENQYYEVARGGVKKVIGAIAGDTLGDFHGLGEVDKALRKWSDSPDDFEIEAAAGDDEENQHPRFVYRKSGRCCTAQEVLHLFFEIPLDVLIEPRAWYVRHRRPVIVEYSPDNSRVLVRFCQSSMSGDPIIGSCLYLLHEEEESGVEPPVRQWGAYTIRPNASDTIATAEAWIVKRKWKPW